MELTVNSKSYQIDDDLSRVLLWVLRDDLGLTGTKFGCGVGICGSCTVLVDGQPIRSCVTTVENVIGKSVDTIEGLAETLPNGQIDLHPVQQAFLETQAPQCSWCMSGQMLTAAAFLNANQSPSGDEIVDAMNRNYCRCGAYVRIREAVAMAAELMDTEDQ